MDEETRYIVLGNIGSDAGYWVFVDGHWEHVGGWGIDSILEVQAALAVLKESSRLRTPGLAEAVAGVVQKFVGAELSEHVGEAHTVVIV
jgi:hypothetical protein